MIWFLFEISAFFFFLRFLLDEYFLHSCIICVFKRNLSGLTRQVLYVKTLFIIMFLLFFKFYILLEKPVAQIANGPVKCDPTQVFVRYFPVRTSPRAPFPKIIIRPIHKSFLTTLSIKKNFTKDLKDSSSAVLKFTKA